MIETGSLSDLGADWLDWMSSKAPRSTYLCPLLPRVIDLCHFNSIIYTAAEDLNSGSLACTENILPTYFASSKIPQGLLWPSVLDRHELWAWCVHVNLFSTFTCRSLSWPSSPQVRPPRGKSSSCYSLLVVVIEGLSILGREQSGGNNSIYVKSLASIARYILREKSTIILLFQVPFLGVCVCIARWLLFHKLNNFLD